MNKDIPSLPNNIDAEKWALGSMIFNKETGRIIRSSTNISFV